jgi:hypothetical protein
MAAVTGAMNAWWTRWWPGRRRLRLTKGDVLGAHPVRNTLVAWEVNEHGEVVLQVPRRQDRLGRVLTRFFAAPDFKQIVLDEVGSEVWKLCTGQNNVDAIVRSLAKKYRLNRREVELSLSKYLQQLARRGLIGLSRVPIEEDSTQHTAQRTKRNAQRPDAGPSG